VGIVQFQSEVNSLHMRLVLVRTASNTSLSTHTTVFSILELQH